MFFNVLRVYNSGDLSRIRSRTVTGDESVSNVIEGQVVAVTESGDLVTDISSDVLANAPTDDSVAINCSGHETLGIFPADHQEPMGTFLAMLNADNALTLTIVGVNLSEMLSIKVGAAVTVKW